MISRSAQWTSEAEASVRQVFAPWHAASKKGSVPRADLRLLLHRLQPNFSDGQLDEILACGTRNAGPNDDVDLYFFLDWIFLAGEASPRAGGLSSPSQEAASKEPVQSSAPALGRAVTDVIPYSLSEEAPAIQRAVTAAANEQQRARRGGRPGPTNPQPVTRRASRGALLRAQELFQQRLGRGAVQMTDQMLLRLTRATSSSSKSPAVGPEDFTDAQLDATLVEIGQSDSEAGAGPAEAPPPRFGEGAAISPTMALGSCGVCWEEVEVGSLCGLPSCRDRYCAECMRRHAEVFVEGAFYAMPWLKCPGCATRVPTKAWIHLVSEEQRARYLRNGEALLTFRCPGCHEVGTAFERVVQPEVVGKAEKELYDQLTSDEARLQFNHLWPRFARAEESAESFSMAVVDHLNKHLELPPGCAEETAPEDPKAWPPKLAWAQHRLWALVEDPERRCCLQLALLRAFPKILTPCCKEQLCFKCKVGTWHPEETCEERQRQEMSKDVQFCPKCGVPTVKSEGCDHIICVCGASWQWQGNPVANAIQTARTEVIEEMLNEGFDINSPIEEEAGETFLHYAARFRVLSMVEFLLERRADPTKTTTGGSSVLMEALSDSHAEGVIPVVRALLTARADVNARADYVSNSLFFILDNWERYYSEGEQNRASAEEREKGVPLVQLLLSSRADVNQRQFLDDQGDGTSDGNQREEEEERPDHTDVCESEDDSNKRYCTEEAAAQPANATEDERAEAPRSSTEQEVKVSGPAEGLGNSRSGSGPTALLLAIQRRLYLIAATIISDGTFCNGGLDLPDDSGNRPLYLSVSNRSSDLVRHLVSAGASVNAAGPENTPPLHEALRAGHEPMVQLLLDSSADANALDDEGLNALHCALEAAKKFDGAKQEVAVALATNMVAKVQDIDLSTSAEETALGMAAAAGHTDVVAELLRFRASVDKPTKKSCTALALAAEEGRHSAVRLLIQDQAAVDARDIKGWTPLHRVAGNWSWRGVENNESSNDAPSERVRALEALLEARALVDAESDIGLTPLLVAVNPGSKTTASQIQVVDALLRHRANVNSCTKSRIAPLALACEANASKIVARLLETRANPNVMDSSSRACTLLSCALEKAAKQAQYAGAKRIYDHSVDDLIRAGASVNATDKNGRTPAIALVEGATSSAEKTAADFDEEATRLIGVLTEAGADLGLAPVAASVSQITPLEHAAKAGRLPLVNALLKNGAAVNGANFEGSTPLLGLCRVIQSQTEASTPFLETGHGQVLKVLLDARANVMATDQDGNTPLTVVFAATTLIDNYSRPVPANAPAMALLLKSVPEDAKLDGDRWQRLLIELISGICAPGASIIVLDVLAALLPKVNGRAVIGKHGESLLDMLMSQLLFSASVVLRVQGADIERFNTEYRYSRDHNGKPLFKSASGAIIYWGGSPAQWKMNFCDNLDEKKTPQSFYSGISGGLRASNTDLPPSAGIFCSARQSQWGTAGWRSQYRCADHACPTVCISKELNGMLQHCGEAALTCARLLQAHGMKTLGKADDAPAGALLRVPARISAAYDAEQLLTSLPEMYLGCSFHELLEACAEAYFGMDDFPWDGEWQVGYYCAGDVPTWKCESVIVQDKTFTINDHACKLHGNGHTTQCEWFDSNTILRIGHLRPVAVSWVAVTDGTPSSHRIVWVRTKAPLSELQWGGHPSSCPLGWNSVECTATFSEGQTPADMLEPWRQKVVRRGQEAKLLRLNLEQSQEFPTVAVGALAVACLLIGVPPMGPGETPPVDHPSACLEYCLRIIVAFFYKLHSWEPGEYEIQKGDGPACLDDVRERTIAIQKHMEASLREASVEPRGSTSSPFSGTQGAENPAPVTVTVTVALKGAALSTLLCDSSLLGTDTIAEAKDPRVTHLHAFVRDVAVARNVVQPEEAQKPPIRWASLEEVYHMLEVGLATPALQELRCSWLHFFFEHVVGSDVSASGDHIARLALRCPGLPLHDVVLPLLHSRADVTNTDSQGCSVERLLKARARRTRQTLERVGLSELSDANVASSQQNASSAPVSSDAISVAVAIADVEELAALKIRRAVEVLAKQEEFWRDELRRCSQSEKEDSDQEALAKVPPAILTASSPNGMCEPEGEYVLDPDIVGNGQPVWRKRKGMLYWLYSGKSGKWHLGSNECKNMNFNCDKAFLYRNLLHNGRMPHTIGGCWKRWDGVAKKWFDDPDIKIDDCPQLLAHSISGFRSALESVYELQPSELMEIGDISEPPVSILSILRAILTILEPSETNSSAEWNTIQEFLRGEDRAAQCLQKVLFFDSTPISETQAKRLESLIGEAKLQIGIHGGGGTRACIALLKWAQAIATWREACDTYGHDMARRRLAAAMSPHVASLLKTLQCKIAENPSRSEADNARLIHALRVIQASSCT